MQTCTAHGVEDRSGKLRIAYCQPVDVRDHISSSHACVPRGIQRVQFDDLHSVAMLSYGDARMPIGGSLQQHSVVRRAVRHVRGHRRSATHGAGEAPPPDLTLDADHVPAWVCACARGVKAHDAFFLLLLGATFACHCAAQRRARVPTAAAVSQRRRVRSSSSVQSTRRTRRPQTF